MEKQKHSFALNRSGSIGILFGLMAIPIFGIIGVAIDASQAYSAKQKLQDLVDRSAIAGARLPATTDGNRLAAAESFYDANVAEVGLNGTTRTIEATNSDVRVTANYTYPTVIMKLLGFNEVDISATAAARPQIDNGGIACIVALNETMSDAFHLQGINESNSKNCWVWVNSSSTAAMSASGSAVATAQGFCSHGGTYGSEHFGPTPYNGCSPMDDPFFDKMEAYEPANTECQHEDLELMNGTFTLHPGVYCGSTVLKPQADVTMEPGVYVMKHGNLEVQAGASLKGEGVTIFFWGFDTFMTVRGGADVELRAPEEGQLAGDDAALAGFVIVDRKLDWYNPNIYETIIEGGGSLKFEGVMYAPQWRVNISGNSEMNQDSQCFAMVADNFHMEGNGKLNVVAQCDLAGLPEIMPKIKSGPKMLE